MSPVPAGLPLRPISRTFRILSAACALLAAREIVGGCGRSAHKVDR